MTSDDRANADGAAVGAVRIPAALAARLYDRSRATRWAVTRDAFATAVARGLVQAFPNGASPAEVDRHCEALHAEDLALAVACALGIEAAWDHFVREHRPGLYRAAAAIDRTGGARELADSLYADLFGLREQRGERQSLFRYYHGRSSLGTWTRAVLAQRHVDRLRAARRLRPLPEADAPGAVAASRVEPEHATTRHQEVMRAALASALAALAPRDRLRLACYYARNMKLAAIGRLLGEHEASVSRHLARARRDVRAAIDAHLRTVAGYDETAVVECFRTVANDSGVLDLAALLRVGDRPQELGAQSFLEKGDV